MDVSLINQNKNTKDDSKQIIQRMSSILRISVLVYSELERVGN